MKMLQFAKDAAARPAGVKAFDAHSLIVGQPGSGKTKLLDSMILEILRSTDAGVVVVDPKRTGFRAWDSPRVSGRVRVYRDPKTFSNVFEALFQEHERRTAVMEDGGFEVLPDGISRVYVVVDELPSLVSDAPIISKDASKSISSSMLNLLQLARQTGIQLICASQTAEGKNIISATARGYYQNRILLKCSNSSEASMMLNVSPDDVNLDNLLPGECYVRTAHYDVFRAWSKYYSNDQLRDEIRNLPMFDVDFGFLERRWL